MTKQNYGHLLIICKKEHMKYKMAKNSCALNENNSHIKYQPTYFVVGNKHSMKNAWLPPIFFLDTKSTY